jgi:hypothetical protein
MKQILIVLYTGLILVVAPIANTQERANGNNNGGCQIIIGIDMSSSVPWNIMPDELDFAVKNLCNAVSSAVKKGDKIIIKPFGSFQNRTTVNHALQTHVVRRSKVNVSRIQEKVHSVIAGTPKEQNETSIIGFLHSLPRLYPEIPVCRIFLLTDGFEYSEFGSPIDFASGNKELPVLKPNYLEGVYLVFVGFGNTLDSHTSKIVTGLEKAWNKHCENASAKCVFINW